MGTITMVASGKDGVGKSTLSVFLGAAFALTGEKVLVVELDNAFRSIDIISGVYGKLIYDINDVLSGKIEPHKAIAESPVSENLSVMSAPFNPSLLPVDDFVSLTTNLSEAYDQVIIDAASMPGAIYCAASCAMRALLVTTADPVGIRYSRQIVDKLEEYSVSNIRLVINRVVSPRISAGIVPNLDYVIDNIGVQLIGVIPELTDIALASSGVTSLAKNSVPMRIFSNIAERMRGNDVPLLVF